MYGPVGVCWQHDERICRNARPGESRRPRAGEPWIAYFDDANEVLAQWLKSKNDRVAS